jgi:predicted transcriptional regulator
MEGEIDSTFQTQQRDMFMSGIVAEIGSNAYTVWSVIKCYADFKTGEANPGMRAIGAKINLGKSSVQRAVEVLEAAHLVRIVADAKFKSKGQTYVARERLAVRIGGRVICYILVDYVPANLRSQLNRINQALKTGTDDKDVWAEVEIIPGEGFVWDNKSKSFKASIKASLIPLSASNEADIYHKQLVEKLYAEIAPNVTKRMIKK